jgi:hypothetical protein
MRYAVRILVVAAAVAAVVGGAIPGSAGAASDNTVLIKKDVSGDPAPGTTFTVEVHCESVLGAGAAALPFTLEVTFDEEGVPTNGASIVAPAGSRCTATETADGGASSTAYACSMKRSVSDDEPPFLGNCTGDNQATFGDVVGDTATITVSNTFPLGQSPPPITPVAEAVQAAPTFTG